LKMIGLDWILLTCYENRTLGRDALKAFLSSTINETKNMNPLLTIEDMKLLDTPTSLMNFLVSLLPYLLADVSSVSVW
jgi:hypothetical protein